MAPRSELHTTHFLAEAGLLNAHAGHTHLSCGELTVTFTAGMAEEAVLGCRSDWPASCLRRAASWSGLNCGALGVKEEKRKNSLRSKTDLF